MQHNKSYLPFLYRVENEFPAFKFERCEMALDGLNTKVQRKQQNIEICDAN